MSDEKDAIRRSMISLRARLSREEVLGASERIQEKLFDLPKFVAARVVSSYVAKKENGEVETEGLIRESLKMGKRVVVPFVQGAGELSFCELKDYDSELEPGAFGILEPKSSNRREFPLREIELMVVPGVAFDLDGYRLGYGRGYYDRALRRVSSENPKALFVGLAHDFQVLDELPRGKADVPVDVIITEKRMIFPK